MAPLEEITARYQSERFRFANPAGDVIVGSAINGVGPITIKGEADHGELRSGCEYRFYGRWIKYTNRRTGETESQFAFDSFTPAAPHSREAVVEYLKRAGEGRRFGPARARLLFDQFGSDAVRKLREEPEACAAILTARKLPILPDDLAGISATLHSQRLIEACTIDVTELLAGKGFPKSTVRAAIKTWGNLAACLIRRDPYKLMRFRGCGFKLCDKLWLELGLPPDRLKRQAYSAWHAVASDNDGHTWVEQSQAENGIRGNVGSTKLRIPEAMELARRAGLLKFETTTGLRGPIGRGNSRWVAEPSRAANEAGIARRVCDALAENLHWPEVSDVPNLSSHQAEQLQKALTGTIAILGGSPGTGKSYTAANLIRRLGQQLGWQNIGVGAPTGKAAVRLTEALNGYKVPLRARTWHSLLKVEQADDGSGWGFFYNEKRPLPFRVLVSDESSMLDAAMMHAILRARGVGTLLLLIGDVNQLPPVGAGAPLRDLIAAQLLYGELREIKRNSGGIVEACAAIRDQEPWAPGDNLTLHGDGGGAEQQQQTMLRELRRLAGDGLDPVWECQILAAVNDTSPLSRTVLNEILQRELNPAPGVPGEPFRIGDKVVCLKNGWCRTDGACDEEADRNDNDEVYVANGEIGEVLRVETRTFTVRLPSPNRVVKIFRGKSDDGEEKEGENGGGRACNWDLGYCLSVHKSQGSQWPAVLVMGDGHAKAKRVCDRSWLYTGISRAELHCLLIGQKHVFDGFCRRSAIWQRHTLLKERILLEQANLELAGM